MLARRPWWRMRFGLNGFSYVALATAYPHELTNGSVQQWLVGWIDEDSNGKPRISHILTTDIPGDDAITILLAIDSIVEGCDDGEYAAARPFDLNEWLSELFAEDKAIEIARMLHDVALSHEGASDEFEDE